MFSSECSHPAYDCVIGWEFGDIKLWFLCKWCNDEHRFQEQNWMGPRHGDLPLTWRFTLTKAPQF